MNMAFNSLDELPKQIKDNLPPHGQDIWMSTFNHAEKEYGDESQAARVAWSAVERVYHKDPEGYWRHA